MATKQAAILLKCFVFSFYLGATYSQYSVTLHPRGASALVKPDLRLYEKKGWLRSGRPSCFYLVNQFMTFCIPHCTCILNLN
jgi:hypothetical protein